METLIGRQGMTEQNSGSEKRISIAIDGPAGAGKSTLAKRVADRLSYLYIDTGAVYRAATWVALEQRADLKNEELVTDLVRKAEIELLPPDQSSQGRVRVLVNGADVSFIIRSRIITRFVSPMATIAGVRQILVEKQQQLAKAGGVVMDGRDIGTVVLPKAELKIFLTASPEIRAKRRLKDMKEMGQIADLETIIADIKERDHIDSTRATAPLKQAEDAILIDTDNYTLDEVCQKVLELCQEKIKA
ncbi:MAG: (d)CMP kinase [Candidatus Obscuribacterales bacterium]|nr:(d)CMP kinase [Candidatus Obscuribacterales bacterium]